jgi:hypothetical protein
MKLNGKMMVAAAMVAGVLGATGCSNVVGAGAQQDDTTAEQGESMAQQAASWFGFRVWAGPRYAPPVVRVEYPGYAPSSRHFWVNGHWSYNGREYVWVGGHWDLRRDGFTYVQPHWDNVNGRWTYMPGHFARI